MAQSSDAAERDTTPTRANAAIRDFGRLVGHGRVRAPKPIPEPDDEDLAQRLATTLDSVSEIARMTDALHRFTAMLEQDLRHALSSRTRSEG